MMTEATQPANLPYVKATSIICGTLVSTDLKRVRHMLERAFGLECVVPEPGLLLARDRGFGIGAEKRGQPYWVLEVRQKPVVEVAQEMLNHWGMTAPSERAVDEAYAKLNEHKEEFGIGRVQKPRFRAGAYACYFIDADSNWWELEYRAPDHTYATLRKKGDLFHD
jgi:L-aminopeptidase/D-esterase-like protein